MLTLLLLTQNHHCSKFFSSVFQFCSLSRTSSSSGLPPRLATSALASVSSSSRIFLVWLKDPNFSSNATHCFFTFTSRVLCRRISECLQLRLILKCWVVSECYKIFWHNLKLCNCNVRSTAFLQYHCTEICIYRHLWSRSSFTYVQAMQLQVLYRHKISLLLPCNITSNYNESICSTVVLLLPVHGFLAFSASLLWTLYNSSNGIIWNNQHWSNYGFL